MNLERSNEIRRRWRLALGTDPDSTGGVLDARDLRIDQALTALYGSGDEDENKRGGLGASSPRVARWLGDIREFFPTPVVHLVQKDAFERLGIKKMLLEPEFLATMEADIHLVADLMSLASTIPQKTKETARMVVRKVVEALLARLQPSTTAAIRGALNRHRRTNRPRPCDIDWSRTIRANLKTYDEQMRTIIPERFVGFDRHRRRVDLDDVILCVDQSGSMATSVVYSSIFAAVMASIPAITTRLVAFDTAVLDMTEKLSDPVDVLFGIQLGGGTDISRALAYCQTQIQKPTKTHLVLITDLFEGGNKDKMLAHAADIIATGVNLIVLLALTDQGRGAYDATVAAKIAGLGAPVFACTPDMFPELMATALSRGDVHTWASGRGIAVIRS